MTRRAASRWSVPIALAIAGISLSGCGGDAPAAVVAKREQGPQWQDVFDGTPELFAVVRPQAIKKDPVYGPFFKTLLRIAEARTQMGGVTALEALDGADEIIVGIRRDKEAEDAAIVIRGVPANLDPEKMNDQGGRPLFGLVDNRAKVHEYDVLDKRAVPSGSVFVLADRTWVVALGTARARARQAFASPFGRPAPKFDAEALASVRVDAAAFLRTERFAKLSFFGALLRKLSSATLALLPAKAGVIATLRYADEDSSAFSEMQVKRLVEELGHLDPERAKAWRAFTWLKDATVTHDGATLIVKLPVPARLLEELPNASAGDIPL